MAIPRPDCNKPEQRAQGPRRWRYSPQRHQNARDVDLSVSGRGSAATPDDRNQEFPDGCSNHVEARNRPDVDRLSFVRSRQHAGASERGRGDSTNGGRPESSSRFHFRTRRPDGSPGGSRGLDRIRPGRSERRHPCQWGPDLAAVHRLGGVCNLFGATGTLSPPPPEGGEFLLADFTVDPRGWLLVLGTLASQRTKAMPARLNGSPLPVAPSAVRIFRFLPNGSPDPTFGQDGWSKRTSGSSSPRDEKRTTASVRSDKNATGIAVDSQGHIVVTGSAGIRLGPSCVHDLFEPVVVSAAFVSRFTDDGALDPGFSGDGLVGERSWGKLRSVPSRSASPSSVQTARSPIARPA